MADQLVLSKRELEILELVATGLTNREIAQELHISPNTVKVHLGNIFEKTGVSSRTEATLYGIEHGLLHVPGGASSQPEKQGWLRKYLWAWITLGVLLVVLLAILGANILFPSLNPESSATADAAEYWQELASMPEARSGMAVIAYDKDIYAIAGEGPDEVSGGVFSYSTGDDAWTSLSEKPTPVTDVQGVLIGEKIYIPGGRTADGRPSDVLEIYDPRRDLWETGARLPVAVSAYALVDFEGEMYLFGGWDGEQALNSVFIYDPLSDSWESGTNMSVPAYDLGAAALTDKIVVLGGRNADGVLNGAEIYYPSRDMEGESPWESFAAMPEGRYGFGVAGIYDTIYVIGGETEVGEDKSSLGIVYSEETWDDELNIVKDLQNLNPRLVTLGSLMYLVIPQENMDSTALWQYQAILYEIYIPLIP